MNSSFLVSADGELMSSLGRRPAKPDPASLEYTRRRVRREVGRRSFSAGADTYTRVTLPPNFECSMNITWNGLGSIVLTAKPGQADVSLVTNPFTSTSSIKFPKQVEASLVVLTHSGTDTENVDAIVPEHEGDAKPFFVTHAGEYEVRGLFATGVEAPKKDGTPHTIFRFDVEGMHVGFLGAIDRPLTSKEQEALGAIDILLIPAGGNDVLSASAAAQLVAQIEPRLVIPLYIATSEEGDGYADASAFLREVSAPSETMSKLKITRAGLPEEDMRVVILTRS
jgi:L-ascorbate metabolism protein UlaG (beta-lactamase superfamily)